MALPVRFVAAFISSRPTVRRAAIAVVALACLLGILSPGSLRAQTVTATVPIGTLPEAVAVNPVTNKIYIANEGSANVTVIDGATNATTTVSTGSHPVSVAVNPLTNKIYVANGTSASVTVIDGATNTVTATVTVGLNPCCVAVNPITNIIYVASEHDNNVTVINGATNNTTTVTVGTFPFGLAVNPLTNKIYVANYDSNNVTVIDGTNNTVMATVSVGSYPYAMAVNPATNKIYVGNSQDGTVSVGNVSVIDGGSNSVTTTVTVGTNPVGLAIDPVTNQVYVANYGSNNVSVIDGGSNSVTTTVTVGTNPDALAIDPVTNQVYVANYGSNNVTVIDGSTNTVTSTVAAGTYPILVAVNPVTNRIFVANSGNTPGTVTVIDGATNSTATASDSSALNPHLAAVNPVTNKIYVVNNASSNVTVIDGATNSTTSVTAGTQPWGVDVNPATNKIYATNSGSANVTVIDGTTNSTTTVSVGLYPHGVVVNPVTGKIYVSSSSGGVTVIDGATDATIAVTDPNASSPTGLAVNPVTNKIYVANNNSNNVTVIDGATNLTTTVTDQNAVGPWAVAVNPVTNKIYVANEGSNNVTVIDGATNSTTTVSTGEEPVAVAVNPITNKIYTANFGGNNVTVIDGATNSIQTVTDPNATSPQAIAVNPVTNKIYVANFNSNNATVIDGTSNTATTATAGTAPWGVTVNPVTNKAYVINDGSNDVTVITEQVVRPIPLVTAITPLTGNATPLLASSFNFSASSTFSPYAPPPDGLYFQPDTWQGAWMPATAQGSGAFSGTTPALLPGFHMLYAYSTDGQDAGAGAYPGAGASPLISNITAYGFLVAPPTATLAPSSLDFGNQAIAIPSAAQTLTLSSYGATLAIAGITFTGPNSSDFSETNTCGMSLNAGSSCTISVVFTPTVSGAESATLTVTDDSGGVSGPTQTVSLTGTGVRLTPSFSNLTPSQSVSAGTTSITLSGTISSGGMYPAQGEQVSIAIGLAEGSATLDQNGNFTGPVTISSLGPGVYPILYHYYGDATFSAVSDQTTSLTVNPAPPSSVTLTLSAALGTGSGTVTDGPWARINCTDTAGTLSGSCYADYPIGAGVLLTATPTSTFLSWGGACAASTSNTCYLQLNTSLSVTANFATQFPPAPLSFNAGTNVSTMATFCPGNASSCSQDPNAHAFTLLITQVSTPFNLYVQATEYPAGDGLCPKGQDGNSSDPDCRFVDYFNYGTDSNGPNPNIIVPLCYPYANGNCVHYDVYYQSPGTEPPTNYYSGWVFWKIGFNNDTYSPPSSSYWANSVPHMFDDPNEDVQVGLPYGTDCNTTMQVDTGQGNIEGTTIYCQYDRDITTFWNPGSGLDSTSGGKTKQPNDVVVAFPPTSVPYPNSLNPIPNAQSAPTISGSCLNGCVLSSTNITFTVGTGGAFAIASTGYPLPTITMTSGSLPSGLTFNATTGLISGTPTSAGTFPFTVTASNTFNGNVDYVSQSYTLTVNAMGLSTSSLNFGTLHLGQVAAQPITLTNTGTTPITITSVSITGPGNAVGEYGDITFCTPLLTKLPGVLPAGKSCPIFVGILATAKIFSPTASTATLTITDSTAASPHLVRLTAQVINPQATLSASSLTFASQTVGTTSGAKTVTLTNTGNTPLTLGTITVSGHFALASSGTPCKNSGTVAAGSSCTISVTFAPTAKGTCTGNVKITDNALTSPQTIWLSGTGK
jgi:YVTN family beta-propeller protein